MASVNFIASVREPADEQPTRGTGLLRVLRSACSTSASIVAACVQGPDCVWYGEAVPCMHFTRLAVIAGIISASNLLLITALLHMAGQVALFESAGTRYCPTPSVCAHLSLTPRLTFHAGPLQLCKVLLWNEVQPERTLMLLHLTL